MFQLHKSLRSSSPSPSTFTFCGKTTSAGQRKVATPQPKKKPSAARVRMRLVGQCIFLWNWQVRSHVFFHSSRWISNYKYIFRAADLYPIEGGWILLSVGSKTCIYVGEYQMNKWTDCRVFWYLILVGKCGVWICGRTSFAGCNLTKPRERLRSGG